MTEYKHYVYKIEFETGHVYFGVRSCECDPVDDTKYLGSPKTHKAYWEEFTPTKVIIREFETRDEANLYEDVLIEWAWSVNKSLSLNATIRNSKFNNFGRKMSEESIQKVSKANEKPYYLVSPEGEVFEGISIVKFCKEKNLHKSGIISVRTGKILHYTGWTASLEAHQLYLESIETRGISFVESRMRWRLTYSVDKKRARNKYFKRWVDAVSYRSQLEAEGCTFLIQCKNWKKKLEEKLSNTRV